jgi:hypothetical protein
VADDRWDPVPWFVEGGAKHSTSLARLMSYTAFGGQEGIIGSKDLEVRSLAVPGGSVRVFPGAASIINRAPGYKYETYVGRLPIEDTLPIAPTGAGASRTDLIVARVENPFTEPEAWDPPADPTVGPYIHTRVIPGVPSGIKNVKELGLGYSALTLAKVTLPPSTGTVLQSHITDLRYMSPTLKDYDQNIVQPASQDTLFETNYLVWPWQLSTPTNVPEWATHVYVHASLTGLSFSAAGTARGDARIDFGGVPGALGQPLASPGVKSQVTVFEETSGAPNRAHLQVGGRLAIPASMRGQTVRVQVEARRYASGSTANLIADVYSTGWINLQYTAAPEPNA